MKDSVRGQYTLEFKQEAVRLVRGGEGVSSVAKSLGISGQTLHNWVKADAAGRLRDARIIFERPMNIVSRGFISIVHLTTHFRGRTGGSTAFFAG